MKENLVYTALIVIAIYAWSNSPTPAPPLPPPAVKAEPKQMERLWIKDPNFAKTLADRAEKPLLVVAVSPDKLYWKEEMDSSESCRRLDDLVVFCQSTPDVFGVTDPIAVGLMVPHSDAVIELTPNDDVETFIQQVEEVINEVY